MSETAPLKVIGFEECLSAVSAAETIDILDRAAILAHGADTVDGSEVLPSAQFSAMAGNSLMFGHMGFVPGLGMCVKTGMQVPGNSVRDVDAVQASVLLFDAETGVPQAVIDGRAITIMRTAGALVAGIRSVLASGFRPNVAVIGFGAQGRHIARLATTVLLADSVTAFSRSPCAPEPGVEAKDSIAEAVAGADVIACATSSSEPVLTLADVRAVRGGSDGSSGDRKDSIDIVIASLNSYQPDVTELDPEIVGVSNEVLIDAGDPLRFGPIARWSRTHEGQAPVVRRLGDRARTDRGKARDRLGGRGISTVLIGGHGIQDSLVAWSVMRGWSHVEAVTRRYTDSEL